MERRLAIAALVTPSAHRPEASSTVAVIWTGQDFVDISEP